MAAKGMLREIAVGMNANQLAILQQESMCGIDNPPSQQQPYE